MTPLYYGAGYAISEELGKDWLSSWPDRIDELATCLGQRVVPGADVYSEARKLALHEMLNRPAATVRMLAKSQIKLITSHSLGDLYSVLGRDYRPTRIFSRLVLRKTDPSRSGDIWQLGFALAWVAFNVAIALGAVAGLWKAIAQRQYLLVICGLTATLLAAATFSNGMERMCLPMMLFLFILVGRACDPVPKRSALRHEAADAA